MKIFQAKVSKIIKLFKHDIKLEINLFKNSFMREEGLAFKIRKKY